MDLRHPFLNVPLEQLSVETLIDPETRIVNGIPFETVPAPFFNTFDSYSGSEISAILTIEGEPYRFAELSTISYSTHREKSLVRSLGTSNPKGYTYGPRTIAGSLVFIQFDEDMIYRAMRRLKPGARVMPDEIPPFHITILFQNSGDTSRSVLNIYNVTIVDNGQVMSIEDLITENTMSYFATSIDLLRPLKHEGFSKKNNFLLQPKQTAVYNPTPKDYISPQDSIYKTLKLKIIDTNNNPVYNARLIFNGANTKIKTDADGILKYKMPITSGEAKIEIVLAGKKHFIESLDLDFEDTNEIELTGTIMVNLEPNILTGKIEPFDSSSNSEVIIEDKQGNQKVQKLDNDIFTFHNIDSPPYKIIVKKDGVTEFETTETQAYFTIQDGIINNLYLESSIPDTALPFKYLEDKDFLKVDWLLYSEFTDDLGVSPGEEEIMTFITQYNSFREALSKYNNEELDFIDFPFRGILSMEHHYNEFLKKIIKTIRPGEKNNLRAQVIQYFSPFYEQIKHFKAYRGAFEEFKNE